MRFICFELSCTYDVLSKYNKIIGNYKCKVYGDKQIKATSYAYDRSYCKILRKIEKMIQMEKNIF